ncbi:hypothetical protein NEAUS04_1343 [Nematocida ausubeli]|uniref:Pre-mRNA polyadenylation factor Fip1 domain-containing protein n=1 Tax=Nematocida ausubeli (strain ATCC PRA-371 / ERTm2) TaxID=1913371 RepID=H8ZA52_NEMA1|nr:uncharacterized protein NESG_00633 [Nematocida ausubeli]EHY66833.1 hypothetical protein NERG_00473 [Nematocida ausubeli]KAI5132933.1 hypothetical protein NEAUS06_0428 [Nematocida ausubeli]KAI5137233.1 hypothetical protein NEAUS07_1892 [Nematocida ausubeli]KAI5149867.1 hypothetical protein NEAUS05_1935 [Nematocida ausubeli]KAI5163073.1 hypothetical protein NEAUS04_1343 [Nematocida ausubeli]
MEKFPTDEDASSDGFEIVLHDTEDAPALNSDLLHTYTVEYDGTDKPWNKPGEDITDYFNYGFNETTWKEYLNKQKKLREKNVKIKKRRK